MSNKIVSEIDFVGKNSMLPTIDYIREKIESGEVVGFCITSICSDGCEIFSKDIFPSQRTRMVGALEAHKMSILTELLADKIKSECHF